MKKQLQVKGYYEGKNFKPTHVKITKKIAKCKENEHFNLEVGYVALGNEGGGGACQCPADTTTGYYECVSGNCVFIPFS